MYCRYCGAATPSDSRFCSQCGKRLSSGSDRWDAIVRRLRLGTPYPWAGVLLAGFLWWGFGARSPEFDYTTVAIAIELDGRSAAPEESLYRQHFSVVVENVGSETIPEVPVELVASVDRSPEARVEANFRGRWFTLEADGVASPIVVVLTDVLEPGDKRRYPIDGIVTANPPFEVRYELRDERKGDVLADFSIEEPASDDPAIRDPAPDSVSL